MYSIDRASHSYIPWTDTGGEFLNCLKHLMVKALHNLSLPLIAKIHLVVDHYHLSIFALFLTGPIRWEMGVQASSIVIPLSIYSMTHKVPDCVVIISLCILTVLVMIGTPPMCSLVSIWSWASSCQDSDATRRLCCSVNSEVPAMQMDCAVQRCRNRMWF